MVVIKASQNVSYKVFETLKNDVGDSEFKDIPEAIVRLKELGFNDSDIREVIFKEM
mgnify:CR=1 FL=1